VKSRVLGRQPGADELNGVESSELASRGIRARKGIRRRNEGLICNFKLQGGCDKSVDRIRLVTSENSSACVTAK
jgi:hypothetical protein